MAFEFKLPDIGEGVVEGEIVKWLVQPGDQIKADQPLVEIMTDKATVVISSPREGIIAELRGAEGDFAAVGSVIVVIGDVKEGGAQRPALTPSSPTVSDEAPSDSAARETGGSISVDPNGSQRVLAAPATRRLARELGVALESVKGSGPAGRVTSDDVKAKAGAISQPQGGSQALVEAPTMSNGKPSKIPTPAPVSVSQEDEVVPVKGVRRRIWDGMTRSAFSAPHFTFVEECDVTALINSRKSLNRFVGEQDTKLTFLPFIIKAVCVALRDYPDLNGHVDEAQQSFVRRADIHIGIAVAAQQGLTVPVVRNADRMSLKALAAKVRGLGDAVRSGQIAPANLGGSTFTVTSLGKEGGLFATPILNHPEVGILGVHRLQDRPSLDDDGQLCLRKVMNLSLSCDHRLIDGHIAARFAYRVIELLAEPDRLFLEMS